MTSKNTKGHRDYYEHDESRYRRKYEEPRHRHDSPRKSRSTDYRWVRESRERRSKESPLVHQKPRHFNSREEELKYHLDLLTPEIYKLANNLIPNVGTTAGGTPDSDYAPSFAPSAPVGVHSGSPVQPPPQTTPPMLHPSYTPHQIPNTVHSIPLPPPQFGTDPDHHQTYPDSNTIGIQRILNTTSPPSFGRNETENMRQLLGSVLPKREEPECIKKEISSLVSRAKVVDEVTSLRTELEITKSELKETQRDASAKNTAFVNKLQNMDTELRLAHKQVEEHRQERHALELANCRAEQGAETFQLRESQLKEGKSVLETRNATLETEITKSTKQITKLTLEYEASHTRHVTLQTQWDKDRKNLEKELLRSEQRYEKQQLEIIKEREIDKRELLLVTERCAEHEAARRHIEKTLVDQLASDEQGREVAAHAVVEISRNHVSALAEVDSQRAEENAERLRQLQKEHTDVLTSQQRVHELAITEYEHQLQKLHEEIQWYQEESVVDEHKRTQTASQTKKSTHSLIDELFNTTEELRKAEKALQENQQHYTEDMEEWQEKLILCQEERAKETIVWEEKFAKVEQLCASKLVAVEESKEEELKKGENALNKQTEVLKLAEEGLAAHAAAIIQWQQSYTTQETKYKVMKDELERRQRSLEKVENSESILLKEEIPSLKLKYSEATEENERYQKELHTVQDQVRELERSLERERGSIEKDRLAQMVKSTSIPRMYSHNLDTHRSLMRDLNAFLTQVRASITNEQELPEPPILRHNCLRLSGQSLFSYVTSSSHADYTMGSDAWSLDGTPKLGTAMDGLHPSRKLPHFGQVEEDSIEFQRVQQEVSEHEKNLDREMESIVHPLFNQIYGEISQLARIGVMHQNEFKKSMTEIENLKMQLNWMYGFLRFTGSIKWALIEQYVAKRMKELEVSVATKNQREMEWLTFILNQIGLVEGCKVQHESITNDNIIINNINNIIIKNKSTIEIIKEDINKTEVQLTQLQESLEQLENKRQNAEKENKSLQIKNEDLIKQHDILLKQHYKLSEVNKRWVYNVDVQEKEHKSKLELLEKEENAKVVEIRERAHVVSSLEDKRQLLCQNLEQGTEEVRQLENLLQKRGEELGSKNAELHWMGQKVTSKTKDLRRKEYDIKKLERKISKLQSLITVRIHEKNTLEDLVQAQQDNHSDDDVSHVSEEEYINNQQRHIENKQELIQQQQTTSNEASTETRGSNDTRNRFRRKQELKESVINNKVIRHPIENKEGVDGSNQQKNNKVKESHLSTSPIISSDINNTVPISGSTIMDPRFIKGSIKRAASTVSSQSHSTVDSIGQIQRFNTKEESGRIVKIIGR